MKSWLQDNNMKMNPMHNKRKPIVAKSFIRTLNNNKTYKYMNSKSKMYILINYVTKLINTTILILGELK